VISLGDFSVRIPGGSAKRNLTDFATQWMWWVNGGRERGKNIFGEDE
jgi:hypothetical protein